MEFIQFSHANSFPAKTYSSFLKHFEGSFQLNYVDQFGHSKYPVNPGWYELQQELIDHIQARAKGEVIGLGHSLGGILTFRSALTHAHLYKCIILMDPPFFSSIKRSAIRSVQQLGLWTSLLPHYRIALNRKNRFEGKEEARAHYASKSVFNRFDDEAFEDYLKHGLIWNDDHLRLTFDPKVEARIYETLPMDYPRFELGIPVYFLYSEAYGTLSRWDIKSLKRKASSWEFIEMKGSHLFPLEYPKETAKVVNEIIKEVGNY